MNNGDNEDIDIKVNNDDMFSDSEDTEFKLDISEDFFDEEEPESTNEEVFRNKTFTENDEGSVTEEEYDESDFADVDGSVQPVSETSDSETDMTETDEENPNTFNENMEDVADQEDGTDTEAVLEPEGEDSPKDSNEDSAEEPEEVEDGSEDISETGEEALSEEDFDEVNPDEESESGDEAAEPETEEDEAGEGSDGEPDGESDYDDEDFVEFVDDGSIEEEGTEGGNGNGDGNGEDEADSGKAYLGLKIFLSFVGAVVIFAIWLLGTSSGRSFGLGIAAKFIKRTIEAGEVADRETSRDEISADNVSYLEGEETGEGFSYDEELPMDEAMRQRESLLRMNPPRSEEYVKTYLLFGLEEINGGSNTDAIMLVSINTKDNTIKLTSICRDTYVDIPGYYSNKINSVYAIGAYGAESSAEGRIKGANLLEEVIERTFEIDISGYAFVNFNRFEKIIDRLGGLDLQLGAEEAEYLRTTNYISIKANRKGIVEGWNYGLNGNQVLGYVRVRKAATLGGETNDYGRTVRQRRVINAIIDKYKASGLSEMISIATDCLGYVRTDLTEEQIKDILVSIVNNKITTTQNFRVPYDGLFYDTGADGIFNGKSTITWTLVMDENIDANIKKLHQFIFLDEE